MARKDRQRMMDMRKMSLRIVMCETFAFKCYFIEKIMFCFNLSENSGRRLLLT